MANKTSQTENTLIEHSDDRKRAALMEQAQFYANERSRNSNDASESERAMCGQIMLISTVLLTGVVAIFGVRSPDNSLTYLQGIVLLMGLLTLALSIYFGICYYRYLALYFEAGATINNNITNDLGKVKYWEDVDSVIDAWQKQ
jgi:hypothetical protein